MKKYYVMTNDYFKYNDVSLHIWVENYTSTHTHKNYYEFFLILEGKIIHILNDKEKVLSPGDGCLILLNQIHCFKPYNNEKSEHLNISIEKNLAEKIFSLYSKNIDDYIKNPDSQLYIDLQSADVNFILYLVNEVTTLPPSEKTKINSIIKTIFSYVICIMDINTKVNLEIPKWFTELLHKIKNLDFETTTIKDIYELSNYSPSMLSIIFKKYLGKSIVQYYTELKLNYSCNLLLKSNYSVLDIASQLNYSSLSHFNHIFKKAYGVSPIQYRKTNINFTINNEITKTIDDKELN